MTGDLASVPSGERPCAQGGIDPAAGAGREGTCRLGPVQVTVVGSGSELRTPVLAARLRAARVASSIPPPTAFGTAERARGRFVIVSYSLRNTGTAPIDYLEAQLYVDGRRYSPDSASGYNLQGSAGRPLPAQPGETVTIRTAFDIPPDAAARALQEGLVGLPAERAEGGTSLSDRGAQGRLRLAGVSADADAGLSRKDPAALRRTRERGAEAAVREVFASIRRRDVRAICRRLTEASRVALGGGTGCTGRVVSDRALRQVPGSSRGLRLTSVLSRRDTRALIVARARGYRGLVTLARQGEYWRVSQPPAHRRELTRRQPRVGLPPRDGHP